MHPRPKATKTNRQIRQAPLQTSQPDRDYVRQVERLAACGYPIRQMPESLPVSHRLGRSRHFLAMCPDPKATQSFASRLKTHDKHFLCLFCVQGIKYLEDLNKWRASHCFYFVKWCPHTEPSNHGYLFFIRWLLQNLKKRPTFWTTNLNRVDKVIVRVFDSLSVNEEKNVKTSICQGQE